MTPLPANDDAAFVVDVNSARDLAQAIAARIAADTTPLSAGQRVRALAQGIAQAAAFPPDEEEA